MRYVTVDDVDHLALGASFLASGGGGDPFLPLQMLRCALEKHGPVQLVDADAMNPEAALLPVAIGGSPSAVVEAFPGSPEIALLREIVEKHLGRVCEAVLPIQTGPVNGLFPIVVAAELGLPCIDSDLMARCFPALEMSFLTLAGFPLSPIFMVGAMGAYSIMQAGGDHTGSKLLRATLTEMGMVAVTSAYQVTARDCREHGAFRSLSRIVDLGKLVHAMESGEFMDLDRTLDACGGLVIFEGTVVEVIHEVTSGIPRGVVTVLGDDVSGIGSIDVLRIDQQSENLIASINGVPISTVPDIITVLDGETGTVVPITSLSRGQHIRVVALPGDPRWHTPHAATLVGPRAFGFDIDPVSVGFRP
ncbi:DUF917 domain-containing protein [Rhodococcus globerulus]|uniref:DUF917 domain-containing protein n=1 Tax=Rhodococcus globerulus TaxID=33008 RepID=A0ABU4C2N4_RHOGO|nr:DUF917 domain-containing protein [Rhodococcus globerulus]MDV6270648.1 DUF917 domain-containing protein [Rhodococcus globerulus]